MLLEGHMDCQAVGMTGRGETYPDVCSYACVRRPNGPQWLSLITQHTQHSKITHERSVKRNSSGPLTGRPHYSTCIDKTVLPSALWLLIAISSPQWDPTQAAQVRLYNWPPGKQHNGVKDSVNAPDKTHLPIYHILLNARFPILLVGTYILACCVLNVFSHFKRVAHFVCLWQRLHLILATVKIILVVVWLV